LAGSPLLVHLALISKIDMMPQKLEIGRHLVGKCKLK